MRTEGGVLCSRASEDGAPTTARRAAASGTLTTPKLRHLEMVVYEFRQASKPEGR
jgi:hypothetical protein